MLTNFDELKSIASGEMNKSFPAEAKKCAVAVAAKSGKIYKGHRVQFPDGQILDAVDHNLYLFRLCLVYDLTERPQSRNMPARLPLTARLPAR